MVGFVPFGKLKMNSLLIKYGYFLIWADVRSESKYFQNIRQIGAHPLRVLLEQLEWVKQLTSSMGYGLGEEEGREADDLIAAKTAELGTSDEIVIVSADKDLGQLVRPGVSQLLPPPTANPRLGWRMLDEQGVEEKFGIPPTLLLDYLSIIGDQADNISGLSGVGPKTAVKWLKAWGHLDGIIENAGRVTPKRFGSVIYENRELLKRNKKLIELDDSIHTGGKEPGEPDLGEMEKILNAMEMTKSIEEMKKRYQS
jgi:DNA polymerase-1